MGIEVATRKKGGERERGKGRIMDGVHGNFGNEANWLNNPLTSLYQQLSPNRQNECGVIDTEDVSKFASIYEIAGH